MGRPVFFNFLEIIIRNTSSCCFITKCKKTANQHTFLFCNNRTRLQNSRVFFLKISKEIGKAWRKSLTRAKPQETREASLPSLTLRFQPRSRPFVWLFALTWIRKNTDCFAVYNRTSTLFLPECISSVICVGEERAIIPVINRRQRVWLVPLKYYC